MEGLPALNQRIYLDNGQTGTVRGYVTMMDKDEVLTYVVMRLSKGEYLESRKTFISTMVVHPSNITEVMP